LISSRWPVNRLMAVAMSLLAIALLALPFLYSVTHVDAFAVLMGLASGFVMVIFFSFWARAYGRRHLGHIQGTAQFLTVLASAVGPLLLAKCQAWTGSYTAVFYILGAWVTLLGVAALCVRLPKKLKSESSS